MTTTATSLITRVHAGANTRAARVERLAELAAQNALPDRERDTWLAYLAHFSLHGPRLRYLFAELVEAVRLRSRLESGEDPAVMFPGRPDLTAQAALDAVCQNVDLSVRPLIHGDPR